MWLIYFKENLPLEREESTGDWDDISDETYQLVNKKLEGINSKIKELDKKIKEEVKRSQIKSKEEYEAEKEQEDIRAWTESLLGIETGIPFRYMYIPEVEILKYMETFELDEKSEGRFEVLLKQSYVREQYVEVGDALSLIRKSARSILDSMEDVLKGSFGEKKGEDNSVF